jgi:hypothetical protein
MSPALTDHTTCPSLGLIYSIYKCTQKHRHELRHARKARPGTLLDPCLLIDSDTEAHKFKGDIPPSSEHILILSLRKLEDQRSQQRFEWGHVCVSPY